jgi:ligand-binding sensor domain-containing protein
VVPGEKEVVVRTRLWGIVVAVGVAMGGQPQGCEQTGKGEMLEPFEYLTREEGYQSPVPGDVTLYQTNGPVTAGSVQALAEGADGTIYAGTFGDGIYIKRRDVDLWTPAEQGPADRFLMTLTTTPEGAVFAGTIQGGMFRSEDGGRHWVASGEGIGPEQVASILHDPRSGLLYAGTGSGVFKSADRGRRWAAANSGLELTLARSLALGPDGTLYTGTGGNGLFASADHGAKWRPINEGLFDERGLRENFIRVLAVDGSGAIYAGSFGGGVFKTADQGRHWTPANEGLTNLSIRGLVVGPDAVYAGTGDGVFQSVNGGRRWESISEGMPNTNVQSLLLTRDGTMYVGTSGGVAVRDVKGKWRTIDRGLLFPGVNVLVADARRGLFAGTRTNGLYRSKDGGQSWGPFNDGIDSRTIRALVVDSAGVQYAATPEVIYRADWAKSRWAPETEGVSGSPIALVAGTNRLYAATSSGLFVRDPGASAWSAVTFDPASGPVRDVELTPDDRVVALTEREVFAHEDDGRWISLGVPMASEEVLGVAAGRSIYAWTERTVYRHRGSSKGWEAVGSGLPRGVAIRALARDDGGRDDVLLVATSAGVWWSLGGREWRPTHGAFPVVPFETIAVADTGLIMAGSHEHGVFVGVNLAAKRSFFSLR